MIFEVAYFERLRVSVDQLFRQAELGSVGLDAFEIVGVIARVAELGGEAQACRASFQAALACAADLGHQVLSPAEDYFPNPDHATFRQALPYDSKGRCLRTGLGHHKVGLLVEGGINFDRL